jgi:hypothetical protein
MGQKLSGGCLCGAIRYKTDADPVVMVNCHCRHCQQTSDTYLPFVIVPKAAVKLTGEPRYYTTTGDSGKHVERRFCASCGAPVVAKLERMPDIIGLLAASLDDPSLYKPSLDIFTSSAQVWDQMRGDTEKRPRGFAD